MKRYKVMLAVTIAVDAHGVLDAMSKVIKQLPDGVDVGDIRATEIPKKPH